MTEQTPVTATPENDLQLVALSPSDMLVTQSALMSWCDEKCNQLKVELDDLREHFLIASNNGWKLRGLQSSIGRAEKRITYYSKIKDAVGAGFLLVPNFPVTVLAVRVKAHKQRQVRSSYPSSLAFNAKPELLPSGDGRYVDDRLTVRDGSYLEPDDKGGQKHVSYYFSDEYETPSFPFALVKPAVLKATERAMALRVFDTIGMVENGSGRDPIMVGQILDPQGNDRRSTFFIAWWLDTRNL